MLELYIHDRKTIQEDRRTGTMLDLPATFVFPPGATSAVDPESGELRVTLAPAPDETRLVHVYEDPEEAA